MSNKMVPCEVCNILLHPMIYQSHVKKHVANQDKFDKSIYVHGALKFTTEKELKEIFCRFGDITEIKKQIEASFAFIKFADKSSVEDALNSEVFSGGLRLFVKRFSETYEKQFSNTANDSTATKGDSDSDSDSDSEGFVGSQYVKKVVEAKTGPPPKIPTVMPVAYPHMMAGPPPLMAGLPPLMAGPPPLMAGPPPLMAAYLPQEVTGPEVAVFIGNILDKVPDQMMRLILAACGTVVSWKRVQTFGYCVYGNPDAGLRALRILNRLEIGGSKKLIVKFDGKTRRLFDEYKAEKRKKIRGRSPLNNELTYPNDYVDEEMKRIDRAALQRVLAIINDYHDDIHKCVAFNDDKQQTIRDKGALTTQASEAKVQDTNGASTDENPRWEVDRLSGSKKHLPPVNLTELKKSKWDSPGNEIKKNNSLLNLVGQVVVGNITNVGATATSGDNKLMKEGLQIASILSPEQEVFNKLTNKMRELEEMLKAHDEDSKKSTTILKTKYEKPKIYTKAEQNEKTQKFERRTNSSNECDKIDFKTPIPESDKSNRSNKRRSSDTSHDRSITKDNKSDSKKTKNQNENQDQKNSADEMEIGDKDKLDGSLPFYLHQRIFSSDSQTTSNISLPSQNPVSHIIEVNDSPQLQANVMKAKDKELEEKIALQLQLLAKKDKDEKVSKKKTLDKSAMIGVDEGDVSIQPVSLLSLAYADYEMAHLPPPIVPHPGSVRADQIEHPSARLMDQVHPVGAMPPPTHGPMGHGFMLPFMSYHMGQEPINYGLLGPEFVNHGPMGTGSMDWNLHLATIGLEPMPGTPVSPRHILPLPPPVGPRHIGPVPPPVGPRHIGPVPPPVGPILMGPPPPPVGPRHIEPLPPPAGIPLDSRQISPDYYADDSGIKKQIALCSSWLLAEKHKKEKYEKEKEAKKNTLEELAMLGMDENDLAAQHS